MIIMIKDFPKILAAWFKFFQVFHLGNFPSLFSLLVDLIWKTFAFYQMKLQCGKFAHNILKYHHKWFMKHSIKYFNTEFIHISCRKGVAILISFRLPSLNCCFIAFFILNLKPGFTWKFYKINQIKTINMHC